MMVITRGTLFDLSVMKIIDVVGFMRRASTVSRFIPVVPCQAEFIGMPNGVNEMSNLMRKFGAVGNLTWAALQYGSLAWLDKMVDEMYAVLSQEAMDKAFPPGFDCAALQTDITAIAA
jgi:hypothetical protein